MLRTLRLLLAAVLLLPTLTAAQDALPSIAGITLDESGTVLAGVRMTARRPDGRTVATTRSDGGGAFAIRGLPAGSYVVEAAAPSMQMVTIQLLVPSDPARSLRVVLPPGGFAEQVVVTAHRTDTRLTETTRAIERVDTRDIERTVAADLTDVLKKNTGVDVIQYSGVLSGIGIRGFRPQFSGINKRSLLLVDGRPSGITNLATMRLDAIERVEVVKGAASAVYGSSAMGGVVNVLTRQSRGPIAGSLRLAAGSFGLSDVSARVGGSLTPRLDLDLAGSSVDQRHDFRMGNGATRPATSFRTYDGLARVGYDVTAAWRVTARASAYRGRDIMTPGDLASGLNSQGSKDLETSSQEIRVVGGVGPHDVALVGYRTSEASHTSNVTSFNPADAPFLPYLSFESTLGWSGFQARDAWQLSPSRSVVFGLDHEHVRSTGRSFTPSGTRVAPFSADATKRTTGAYLEHSLSVGNGRTVITAGGRIDYIVTATLDTPFKTNFRPSEASFSVFNPSVGVSHAIGAGLRAKASVGRAFIPAEASQLTGFTTSTVGGRTQITQGNADLTPERSSSIDIGIEWSGPTTHVDATVFRTVVRDRFISNVVIDNPPAPGPVRVSVRNGLDAHLGGLELLAEHQVRPSWRVFASTTHYFSRAERLTSGLEQDALNVPKHSLRLGADFEHGPIRARVSGRHSRGAKDNDFNLPGFPIILRDNITVLDAWMSYRLKGAHAVTFEINNLLDGYYYEALGYPLQGASFKVAYQLGFQRKP